jgi:glucose-6-phosphate 1-epimerase
MQMNLSDSITIITRDNIQILRIDNDFASAEIALFGGHILSFKAKHDGRERLWVSEKATFDGKKAIRGGVPICWPWFGDHPTNKQFPAHGYVRNQAWELLNCKETDAGTSLSLIPKTSAGDGFTGKAQLTLIVHIGKQLNIQLHTTNLGNTDFTFNCALHSYFVISDITQCELIGLSGQYIDKTQGYKYFDTPAPYKFNQETDRVHLQQPSTLTINDKANQIKIGSTGHDSIVVWNPWRDKSISMSDMADDSYLSMICVETTITQGRTLEASQTHILEQIIQ